MRSLVSILALLQGGSLNIFPIYFFWWAGGGWCGTPYPGWWPFPGPRPDPPDPQPWWLSKGIGVVVGIAGGWAFTKSFGPSPEPWLPAISVLGAFVASRVVGDIVAVARGALKGTAR
jgi:hypothetical protein